MPNILSDPHLLREVARALILIDEAGELPACREHVQAAWCEYKSDPDRKWMNESPLSYPVQMGQIFARMTSLPVDVCASAIRAETDPDWPTLCCQEILAFSKLLLQKKQSSKSSKTFRVARLNRLQEEAV
jgi:hypothetical protein